MKVKITRWNTVATWRWDIPEDDVCGICQVHFDGTCPTCKYPGDDCSLLSGKCGHNFHMLTPGNDDHQRDDVTDNPSTDSPRRTPRKKSLLPSRRQNASSHDLHSLMMADVPTSPRPEAELPAPSLSSSQNQNQYPTAPADAGVPSENNPNPGAIPAATSADAADADDVSPVAPKLDPAGFFTLISNATTNTTHHPTVKYVFLDDDPDTLTAALAAHHAANQAPTPSSSRTGAAKNTHPANRALLLDVVPGLDGQWQVSSAASLSAEFAVTDARIARQEGEKEGGLVLMIEGVENEGLAGGAGEKDKERAESLPSSNSGVARSGGDEYGPLLEDFERKMSVLRRVAKASEGRAEKAREQKAATADAEARRDVEE
ncbi:Anaphase-promoting complex subunit 11 [Colletotrichum chlorophyti]|uniref:Anaphase-promoting complex subunit 11 n=1 Tax=Colletotrichum chlorophyti TaxID=708187 RepID=A0A1Q8RR93_9PEZI|nr:Anaphase-promoting complex subunit 11 [Colletotrichum chlorophyti]